MLLRAILSSARASVSSSEGVYVARHLGPLLVPGLANLLDCPLVYSPWGFPPPDAKAIVGWGLKGKFKNAAIFAAHHGLPYLAVEDGFLRSVGLGDSSAPLSVVLDDIGVYYDATRPSRLEQQIASPHDASQRSRGAAITHAWRDGRLSKYNHAREQHRLMGSPFVLVVDQTAGDASIALGMATADSFTQMLEAALDEHPGVAIVLKVHPDVIAGRKRAHFADLSPGAAQRVTLLASNAHPPSLLQAAEAVYVVTSQMGFEALLWKKRVRAFGMPFYAGWGLTSDELPPPPRRAGKHVTLEDLTHAALVEYPRYIDPETLHRCEVERVMTWMALQRCMRERFPERLRALNFARWRRPMARAFFAGTELVFAGQSEPDSRCDGDAVWGSTADDSLRTRPTQDRPCFRVRDGLLRGTGLPRRMRPPSWLIDGRGVHDDATAPSDLEVLLQTTRFDDALLERARALRQRIVELGALQGEGRSWQRPPGAQQLILVPGQVDIRESVADQSRPANGEDQLLRALRRDHPGAYLVYGQAVATNIVQRFRARPSRAREWCDAIATGIPMRQLIDAADEVHVLTSLVGFEALLTGRRVVCHGDPFYAGWGLTEDRHPHPRRTRRLSLDEIVAGALILYPTYVNRAADAFTTPERALDEFEHEGNIHNSADPLAIRMLRGLKRSRDRLRSR